MEIRRSEKIGKLTRAMCKARLNFGVLDRDQVNAEYLSTYPSLANEIATCIPELARAGVNVYQVPRVIGGRAVEVTTMLSWSSEDGEEEQFLAFELVLPAVQAEKFDAQSIASAITLGRRYSIEPALCIAGKPDDDGNAAVGRTPKPAQPEKKSEVSQANAVGQSRRLRFPEIDDSKASYSI